MFTYVFLRERQRNREKPKQAPRHQDRARHLTDWATQAPLPECFWKYRTRRHPHFHLTILIYIPSFILVKQSHFLLPFFKESSSRLKTGNVSIRRLQLSILFSSRSWKKKYSRGEKKPSIISLLFHPHLPSSLVSILEVTLITSSTVGLH